MEKSGGKMFLQWETHSRQLSKGLCMLLERQCLVDIAICCGSNTMHAHKCILAANSAYFKDHLENKAIEQVVINGVDFAIMKAIVEFIYCGECVLAEEHLKHFVAAVKLFKITALENIFMENEYQSLSDDVSIAPPQFVCKPPKYPTVYKPFSCGAASTAPKITYPLPTFNQHKLKRKFGSEAEKACAKEAQASRIALANLRKAMASTPQVHSFIVEESFNETTVENFIPNVEEHYEDFSNTNGAGKIDLKANASQTLTADKIKHILGNEEVEIMFQTSDGNFVNVSDEVLLNLSKGGLQYQVVDENGQVGELQELKSINAEKKTADFDLKLKESGATDIDLSKTVASEDYIDQNLSDKSHLDALPFGESLYEHTFNNAEMFEPENLSMHTALMNDNNGFEEIRFKLNKSNEPLNLEVQQNGGVVEETDGESTNKSLKFTPDMFFADLPGNTCTDTNNTTA